MSQCHQGQDQREPKPAPADQQQAMEQAPGQGGVRLAPIAQHREAHQLALIVAGAPEAAARALCQQAEQGAHGRIGPAQGKAQLAPKLAQSGQRKGERQQQYGGGTEPLIERTGGAAEVDELRLFRAPGLIHQLGEAPEQGPLHPGQGKAQQGAGPLPHEAQHAGLAQRLVQSHHRQGARLSSEPACCLQPRHHQRLLGRQGAAPLGELPQGARLQHQQQEQQVEQRLGEGEVAYRPEAGGAGHPDHQQGQQPRLALLTGRTVRAIHLVAEAGQQRHSGAGPETRGPGQQGFQQGGTHHDGRRRRGEGGHQGVPGEGVDHSLPSSAMITSAEC